ncbi:response regulator transcription factor [Amycolatopsis samaneae]|uniref:DNA-binding response regulator n=1 Tax=Amycolatopsis samaneae TaxID=664691 RepID=A0ABW5G6M7_9PSEU
MSAAERAIGLVFLGGNDLFHDGMEALLSAEPGLRLLGGREELEHASEGTVVLVDVGAVGTVETFQLISRSPTWRIVLIGDELMTGQARELLTRGASAYIRRSDPFGHLVTTIKAVSADFNDVFISVSRDTLPTLDLLGGVRLSERETAVLRLVFRALKNDEIARLLYISPGTVKRHLANIYAKLGAVSRIDALNKAVAAGLLSVPHGEPGPAMR